MGKTEYFDYEKVSREMGVSEEVLNTIVEEVREEFPSDRMMFELHVLRAVKSRYRAKKKITGTH